MFLRQMVSPPRALGKWCAYALILLAPGSFVVLPVIGLIRFFVRKDYLYVGELAWNWGGYRDFLSSGNSKGASMLGVTHPKFRSGEIGQTDAGAGSLIAPSDG